MSWRAGNRARRKHLARFSVLRVRWDCLQTRKTRDASPGSVNSVWAPEVESVSSHRIPTPACDCKPKIPNTRYEYQDSLCTLGLTGAQLKVLLYLLRCGARTGEAWPKHATIARVCRLHQDTARRATHQLEEAGLIRIVRGRTHNRYRFPWHRGWDVRSGQTEMSDLPPYIGKQETELQKRQQPSTAPAPVEPDDAAAVRDAIQRHSRAPVGSLEALRAIQRCGPEFPQAWAARRRGDRLAHGGAVLACLLRDWATDQEMKAQYQAELRRDEELLAAQFARWEAEAVARHG